MLGYVHTLNKLLMLPVPLFCLRFLSPVVHNFSNHTLSNSEHYLLSLGLKFRPTPCVLSLNVLNKQLDDLVRSVHLKYFFVTMIPCTYFNFTSCPTGILQNVLLGLKFLWRLLDLSYILCLIVIDVIMYMYHPICHVLNYLPWPVSVP